MEFMSRVGVCEGKVPTIQNQKRAAMWGSTKRGDCRVHSVHNEGPARVRFRTMHPPYRLLWRQAFQHGSIVLKLKEVRLASSAVSNDGMQ